MPEADDCTYHVSDYRIQTSSSGFSTGNEGTTQCSCTRIDYHNAIVYWYKALATACLTIGVKVLGSNPTVHSCYMGWIIPLWTAVIWAGLYRYLILTLPTYSKISISF